MTDPIAWHYAWGGEYAEQLSWETDVQRAPTGGTQHRRLLTAPRVEMSFSSLLEADQRRDMETTLRRGSALPWLAPLPVDTCLLTAAVDATDTALPIELGIARIPVGSSVMLVDGDHTRHEIAEVTGVANDELTLADGLASSWPEGTRVVPVRRARFSTPPAISRFTGDATDIVSLVFRLMDPLESTPGFSGATYRDFPVFDFSPSWAGPPMWVPERFVQAVDYGLAEPVVSDLAGVPLGATKMLYTLLDGASVAAFRSALYALAGRWSPAWVPTWSHDARMVASTPSGQSYIDVAGPLLAGEPLYANRRDLRIERHDGTATYARITAATDQGGGVERLTLGTAFGSGLALADVSMVSFVVLSVQSADVNLLQYFSPTAVDCEITWMELAHGL